MKKVIFMMLVCVYANGQMGYNEITRQLDYKKVVKIEMPKEVLKANANKWLVLNYKNTNDGIKLNSEDIIIGKGVFDGVYRDGLGSKRSCRFHYTIQIEFKEGKYRLIIDNFSIEPNDEGYSIVADMGLAYPFEDPAKYVVYQKELIELTYPNLGKEAIIKKLDNPKRVKKWMETQRKHFDVVEPQIVKQCESTARSLEVFLKSEKNDDW